MHFVVLDTAFQETAIVDYFENAIWTDRYNKAGDFEIQLPATQENLSIFRQDYYLYYNNSPSLMIVEALEVTTDVEDGSILVVTGRSLESILDRRIAWGVRNVIGNFEGGIATLLKDDVISPANPSRRIPNFTHKRSTNPEILSLTVDTQFVGDPIYDAIEEVCHDLDVGFRVRPTSTNGFEFELYRGRDRSYGQTTNPYVVFSPSFDNLLNSRYYSDKSTYKTCTLIAGEEKDGVRKYATTEISSGAGTGLARREVYTDAKGTTSRGENNETIDDATYTAMLKAKGSEKLAQSYYKQEFDGEAEPSRMFVYGEDFEIGDIVQIENEYGMTMRARITEYIQSYSAANGLKAYPTFTAVNS